MTDSNEPGPSRHEDPTAPPAPEAPPVPPAPWVVPTDQPAYGQDPYTQGQPHGQPAAYGQPPEYGPPPAHGQPYPGTYGPPPASNGSLIALTITSGVATVMCCNVLGIPALILGIVGLTKQSTDPVGAAKLARWGWIAFGVSVAIAVIGLLVVMAIGLSGGFDDGSSYDYEGL